MYWELVWLCLAALAAGPRSIAELGPELYKGLPPALMRFAHLQMLAGLQKLEREGLRARVGIDDRLDRQELDRQHLGQRRAGVAARRVLPAGQSPKDAGAAVAPATTGRPRLVFAQASAATTTRALRPRVIFTRF